MQIRRDTWHYRIYAFTFSNPPEQTSLCRYVWRLILVPIPLALLITAIQLMVGVAFVICNALSILGGEGITVPDKRDEANNPFRVKRFGNIKLAGRSVRVATMARIFWVVVAAGVAVRYAAPWAMQFASTLPWKPVGAVVAAAVVLYIAYRIFRAVAHGVRHSEAVMLAKAYFKARKEGVCPLVTFE